MYRLKIIPLIIKNFWNLFPRFIRLILKKKGSPELHISAFNIDKDHHTLYSHQHNIELQAKNGLILKINKSYIAVRKNDFTVRLNNFNSINDIAQFKLIGAFKGRKQKYYLNKGKTLEFEPLKNDEINFIPEMVLKKEIHKSKLFKDLNIHGSKASLSHSLHEIKVKHIGSPSTVRELDIIGFNNNIINKELDSIKDNRKTKTYE